MAKPTILVVDDEALIRWPLTERLKTEGYEVLEAETGAAALSPARREIQTVTGRDPSPGRTAAQFARVFFRNERNVRER